MAALAVTLHPLLRPWRQCGIAAVLTDQATATRLKAPEPRPGQGLSGSVPGSVPAAAAPPVPTAPAVKPLPHKNAAPVPPTANAVKARTPRRLPLGEWPAVWQELFKRTAQKPVALWTYPELGADLARQSGAAGSARGTFLRQLFERLALAPGSHALWPVQMDANAPVQADIFISGALMLRPRVVFLFGDSAAQGINAHFGASLFQLDAPRPLQLSHSGLFYVLFEDIAQLQARQQGGVERLVAFAKSILQQ